MESLFNEDDWYRATTLAERASLWRTLRTVGGEGPRLQADPELAVERLDLWRTQNPFQREELLQRRLAAEGLSVEDFQALLGESPGRFRDPSGPPAWLAELDAAFREDARLAPEEAQKLELAVLVEPLLVRARERLRTAAERIAESRPRPLFEPASAVEAMGNFLLMNLGRALTRTMILELHIAARTGQIHGATPKDQMLDFAAWLRRSENALGILRQYPVAARYVVECCERWLAFATEMLTQLADDADLIRETFFGGEDPGLLVEARGGVSDPHRGQRTVLLLRFQSGQRLVYKPKPLALDAAFQGLLAWLNERGADPAFRLLKVVDRGTYGWVEFLTHAGCASAEEVHRFYRRQGGYLALFYILAATDFHHENLLAVGEDPVPIDLETLFHSSPVIPAGRPPEPLADEAVWDSVLRPGLLPQRIWAADNAGVDISGMGAVSGQKTSSPVLRMEGGEDDLVHFTRKIVDLPVGLEHRPLLQDKEVAAQDYSAPFAAGFESVYRLVLRHREEFAASAGPLAACADVPTRFIARPTLVYERTLSESFHPYLTQDALDRDRFLDRLWVDIENRKSLEPLLAPEHRALDKGDIPLFTSLGDSRDLWASTGEHLPGLLVKSGLERVRRILSEMGESDLARQLRIVQGTLATLHMHDQRQQSWPSYLFQEAEAPAPADRFLAAARAVGDHLESLAFRQNGSATWLGFRRMGATGFWAFEPVGYGIYSGICGIALFLGHLGAVTGESRYGDIARAGLATVLGRLRAESAEWIEMGAYTGFGSVLYTCLQLGTLWGEPELVAEIEAMVAALPKKIEQDENLDLLSGSAGCLVTLLQLHAHRPARQTLDTAILCGERLLEKAMVTDAGLGWLAPGGGPQPLTGLSHGTAGIAWALAELASVTGEERFREAARGALAYERSHFSADKGNWPDLREELLREQPGREPGYMCAWCHGAPGVGLARLATLPVLSDPGFREEIDIAVDTTLREGFGTNHSLCHGDLGNLDFVLEAGRRLGRGDLTARIPGLATGVLRGIDEHGWLSGSILAPEIPGLMLGIAGIGYQLLRLAAVDKVPSVLLLEPPR